MPSQNEEFQNKARAIIGSTAQILVGLAKAFLEAGDLPTNDPAIIAIKRFVVINCRTAQIATTFAELPDISMAREKVEVGLSKLNTINEPTAKTNFALFVGQYKTPSENVKQELNTLSTLRTDYKNIVDEQHQDIIKILDTLRKSSDRTAALQGPDIKNEFATMDSKREKLSKSLQVLGNQLIATNKQLESLFSQVLVSIPVMARSDVTQKIAQQPVAPDSHKPE
jgi:hypothetical protein